MSIILSSQIGIKKPPSDIFVRWRPDHQIPSETLMFLNPEQTIDNNTVLF